MRLRLQRQMTTERITCVAIARSLMPRKPGERVKTNRCDARGSWWNLDASGC